MQHFYIAFNIIYKIGVAAVTTVEGNIGFQLVAKPGELALGILTGVKRRSPPPPAEKLHRAETPPDRERPALSSPEDRAKRSFNK